MSNLHGALQAHQQYLSSGKLSAALLRHTTFRAWERSHLQGASARRAKAIELEPLEKQRLLDKEREIILAAQPYLQALSKAAGDAQHAAMLGDVRAIVLEVIGDEQSVHGPTSVPGPGCLLDEAVCGANGIGSPLAEGGYTEFVGPEHFIEGFHPFTCQGVPIRNGEGEIVGSLSVSVKRPEAGRRLREILICAARGIEVEILRRRLEQDLANVSAYPSIREEFLERLRQDLMQSLTAARLNFELAARDLSRQRPEEAATKLLQWADRAMAVFRRQNALWRNLITNSGAPARDVDVNILVWDLTNLLETERRTGNITLDMTRTSEPVTVWADPHETARMLFRALMNAFDFARDGGVVNVAIRPTLDGQGEVFFDVVAAPTRDRRAATFSVKWPLSRVLYFAERRSEDIG